MKGLFFSVLLVAGVVHAQSGNAPAGSKGGAETVRLNSKAPAEGSGQANPSKNPLDTPEARKLAEAVLKKIEPGTVWNDENGRPIQAHGGGILKQGAYWYWFGEDRTQGLDKSKRYISCYRSKDLTHWEVKNRPLELSEPEEYRKQFGENWQA